MKIKFIHSFNEDHSSYKQFALLPTIVFDWEAKDMFFYLLFAGLEISFKDEDALEEYYQEEFTTVGKGKLTDTFNNN